MASTAPVMSPPQSMSPMTPPRLDRVSMGCSSAEANRPSQSTSVEMTGTSTVAATSATLDMRPARGTSTSVASLMPTICNFTQTRGSWGAWR